MRRKSRLVVLGVAAVLALVLAQLIGLGCASERTSTARRGPRLSTRTSDSPSGKW